MALFTTFPSIRPLFCGGLLFLLYSQNDTGNLEAKEFVVASREQFLQVVQQLQAGDTLKMEPGVYRGGIGVVDLQGTASQPITIQGSNPEQPPVFEGGGSTLQLSRCSHVHLSDLRFEGATGNGVNIDDGGAQNPRVVGIQLQRLHVSKIGPSGNCDGIKLSGLEQFSVKDCVVENWGDGGSGIDMVGCHDGLIEGCRLSRERKDTANLSSGTGVQMKGGTSGVTVARCRFEHVGNRGVNAGGSTGADYFRPLDANAEASQLVIKDNLFIGGQCAVAFVGVDGATFSGNTILRPGRWSMRILQENRDAKMATCRNVTVEKNTIVFESEQMVAAINIGPNTQPESFRFIENVWYCQDRPESTQQRISLPTPEQNGKYGQKPDLSKIDDGE